MASWYGNYQYQHMVGHLSQDSVTRLFLPCTAKPHLASAPRNSDKGLSVDECTCNLATCVLCYLVALYAAVENLPWCCTADICS